MHISIMLVFWSLVRNSVVLAVYLLFSVAYFFTVHEHFAEGSSSPPDERKEGDTMYVTYQDLIQIGILIVALANLIYQVYKGKKK